MIPQGPLGKAKQFGTHVPSLSQELSPVLTRMQDPLLPTCIPHSSFGWLHPLGMLQPPPRSRQAGARSRRAVPGAPVRVPVLRGVCMPGLRRGAARVPRGRA